MNFLDERWTEIPQGLDRANLYPYEAPRINFIINKGKIQKLPNEFKFDKRIPILAIVSNRSPSQLLRKFGKLEIIPVTNIIVNNFDVTYASLISYYGAVPATLWPVKGSKLQLSIIWLNDSQLKVMHETEAVGKAYEFVKFDNEVINFKSSFIIKGNIFGYVSKFGALNFGSKVFEVRALSAIKAKKRMLKSINQQKALKFLSSKILNISSKKNIFDFRNKVISDKNYRFETIKKLNKIGIQPAVTPWKIVRNIKTKSIKFY